MIPNTAASPQNLSQKNCFDGAVKDLNLTGTFKRAKHIPANLNEMKQRCKVYQNASA